MRKLSAALRSNRFAALAGKILEQAEKEKDPQWQFALLSFAQMVAIESHDLSRSFKIATNGRAQEGVS